ncbi:Mitochondria-eating protein [Liparis tanakae]|uniref:Mitochondria-eating protein n=1 Tax=Liparis tanakae TaxID=230148 RepID=A0A4Z2FQB6_9TELE|nr:Mitochondria-eating protein [Liparis tanakae]
MLQVELFELSQVEKVSRSRHPPALTLSVDAFLTLSTLTPLGRWNSWFSKSVLKNVFCVRGSVKEMPRSLTTEVLSLSTLSLVVPCWNTTGLLLPTSTRSWSLRPPTVLLCSGCTMPMSAFCLKRSRPDSWNSMLSQPFGPMRITVQITRLQDTGTHDEVDEGEEEEQHHDADGHVSFAPPQARLVEAFLFDGHYAGVDTLKTRLLPWLGTCFSMATPSIIDDSSLQLIQDSVEKDRRIRELSVHHVSDKQKLCSTRLQLDSTRAELADAQVELDQTKSQSATTLLATEEEILQLRADLRSAHEQLDVYRRKMKNTDDDERQIRLLRDEVSYLSKEKAQLQERAQLTNSSRRSRLVSRFSNLHAVERPEAQATLRRHLRVRKTMSPSLLGPDGAEAAAVDYIVRNMDLHDLQASVNEVIGAMNVNPRISFPPEVDFVLISTLIRETCRVAFAMQTLEPPPDLAFACDGELYDDRKYRRSYDSELSAPLVMYHVWPALVEGDAVWSRGGSPVRSRSLSPTRTLVFSSRRSLSPGRLTASRL